MSVSWNAPLTSRACRACPETSPSSLQNSLCVEFYSDSLSHITTRLHYVKMTSFLCAYLIGQLAVSCASAARLPVCRVVLKFHEHDAPDLLLTSSRGCHEDATRKKDPVEFQLHHARRRRLMMVAQVERLLCYDGVAVYFSRSCEPLPASIRCVSLTDREFDTAHNLPRRQGSFTSHSACNVARRRTSSRGTATHRIRSSSTVHTYTARITCYLRAGVSQVRSLRFRVTARAVSSDRFMSVRHHMSKRERKFL